MTSRVVDVSLEATSTEGIVWGSAFWLATRNSPFGDISTQHCARQVRIQGKSKPTEKDGFCGNHNCEKHSFEDIGS